MSDTEIALEATGVVYRSSHDEAAFFEWLDKIPAVRSYKGELRTLYITVDASADDESIYELVALFHRYHVDMSQLRVFDTDRIGEWFRKPNSYWYESVFGTSG
ncbi:hypothetical protein ACLMAJ_29625 [Nocardia sp. KC 131]|uniref:hypothetical protein n=1 Tax=Nocardia arseniciresistens TaxID=3392119 RepID=UPI00398F6F39